MKNSVYKNIKKRRAIARKKLQRHISLIKTLQNDAGLVRKLLIENYGATNPKIQMTFAEPQIPYLSKKENYYEPDSVFVYVDGCKWECLVLEVKGAKRATKGIKTRLEMLEKEQASLRGFLTTQGIPKKIVNNLRVQIGAVYGSKRGIQSYVQ